ncbi:hypothetical protein SK803_43150 [Lentzea sp. BCCO 10_0856]|uniref:HMG box domain-containing protein n=1 Tax=Lentzea miocenica TaxID=3095431 RepID=A0ABU4TFW0_9PSEU|nr:hypothetical protein [Lentzea sp. BCCO 10_0856]MDX8037031.1 hypothetical protein [Lentzea sp. BCCO 10_0856]
MDGLTAEALGEKWLSLTNEQRSELLSQRRENQLNEKTLDEAPTNHGKNEQPSRNAGTPMPIFSSSPSHQSKEFGHAQEVLHRTRP